MLTLLLVLVGALTVTVAGSPVSASPAEQYTGPWFGDGNVPPGCSRDWTVADPNDFCYRIKTNFNALDSPQVDVLVLVPVSATAERDMRIMRQSVEAWEGGIDYLARQMGLDWLADGMKFHVTLDYVDPDGEGGEFTTYPVVDPEIVVVAANPPVGGAGGGLDPVDGPARIAEVLTPLVPQVDPPPREDLGPCHGIANPFDRDEWESLPGFDSHHDGRSGTYVEDCSGAGGNICFAVSLGGDPAPDMLGTNTYRFFDLVAHEFGHCLSLAHVGDASGDTYWPAPYTDIMAYSQEPPGRTKCVSTLDVEGIAVRMSRFLDTNGDSTVNGDDLLLANDQRRLTNDLRFQVQRQSDHLYASSTGSPLDCPQPDVGPLPGERTDWTPTPVDTSEATLTVTGPRDGAVSADGTFDVTGTLARHSMFDEPTSSSGSYDDDDDDAGRPEVEILDFDAHVTATDIEATMRLAALPTASQPGTRVEYHVAVDGQKFTSQLSGSAVDMSPDGTSSWDPEANTVFMRIPRAFLEERRMVAPYTVTGDATFFLGPYIPHQDHAPDTGEQLRLAAPGTTVDIDEQVHVRVDGVAAGSSAVDTSDGADSFAVPVQVTEGTHELEVVWERDGEVLATRHLTVSRGPDADGDEVGDGNDNCVDKPNPDQANLDGDARGDVCDPDMDGDGYSNAMELALGTDPADPRSYPGSVN